MPNQSSDDERTLDRLLQPLVEHLKPLLNAAVVINAVQERFELDPPNRGLEGPKLDELHKITKRTAKRLRDAGKKRNAALLEVELDLISATLEDESGRRTYNLDGLLAALSPSATEPAAVSEQDDKNSRINVLKAMQPPARKAYLAYQIAELKAGSRLEDRKAYDLLKEEGLGDNAGDLGELNDYPLPAFESWSRKLRDARRLLGEQKHSPRAGRASGSVVSRDQI